MRGVAWLCVCLTLTLVVADRVDTAPDVLAAPTTLAPLTEPGRVCVRERRPRRDGTRQCATWATGEEVDAPRPRGSRRCEQQGRRRRRDGTRACLRWERPPCVQMGVDGCVQLEGEEPVCAVPAASTSSEVVCGNVASQCPSRIRSRTSAQCVSAVDKAANGCCPETGLRGGDGIRLLPSDRFVIVNDEVPRDARCCRVTPLEGQELSAADVECAQEQARRREQGLPATAFTAPTAGIEALAQVVRERLSIYVHTFSCRNVAGTRSLSEHGVGRAADFMLNAGTPEAAALLDWLYRNTGMLGIQSIIHDMRVWGYGRYHWRAYDNPRSPHRDHIHIGMTIEASNVLTRADVEALWTTFRLPGSQ